MYIGLIVIGLKGMVRKETGYKVFVVVTDTRNKTNRMKGIIGTIEADMNQNRGIFYLSPDYFMSIKDFCKYYEIGILTKGLDNMEGETLALCIGFIGQTSNNISIKYKINIKDIVKLMASKGIKIIAPFRW